MEFPLGTYIRLARGARSREEFAVIIGCGFFSLGRWERGDTIPQSRAHVRQLIEQGVPEAAFVAAGVPIPAEAVAQ